MLKLLRNPSYPC